MALARIPCSNPLQAGELEFLPALWKDLGNFSVAGDFSLVTFFSSVKRK